MINQMSEARTRIRLIGDVSAAAFRHERTRQVAMWYCLRALNGTGSGILDKGQTMQQLVQVFRYSRRTAYEHFALGLGGFWEEVTINGCARIRICGLLRVLQTLGVGQLRSKHFREIGCEDFSTSRQRIAQLYASIHSPWCVKSNPITRKEIAEYSGVTKGRQLRLEKSAGILRVPNHGMIQGSDLKVRPMKIEVFGKAKSYLVNKRLPNSYRTHQASACKGMLKRTARALRSCETGEARSPSKVFFPGVAQLAKGLSHRGPGLHTGYARIRPTQRLIRDRQEWLSCSVRA